MWPRFFALVLYALPLACGTSSSGSHSTPDDAASDSPAQADAGGPAAPLSLRAFETDAEGVSDACKVGDYAKAQGVLGEANANYASLKPQVEAAGASPALVSKLDSALATIAGDISSKSQKACESDANAVTLAVPDLFDLYSWPVPSDALRGDGVFRQLQIDGEYSDWSRAPTDLDATKSVWARLKALAQAQAPKRPDIPGSTAVVADMDKAIQDSTNAVAGKDAVGLQAAAQNGLDAVDVVEAMFK
jgi:hypothetical protein